MKQVAITESFQWAQQLWPILKQFENDGVNYYKVIASNADIRNRNNRVYTTEELNRAASSLSERPLNINHDPAKQLDFPENQVMVARFEEGHVECIIQIADKKIQKMIESCELNAVSIEGMYLDGSKNTNEIEYPSSLHFQALALLTRDDTPGDPFTRILKESLTFAIPGVIMEKLVTAGTSEKETSALDIDNLPDSAFAYISPGGKKDSEGKTTPRSLRHLPYTGMDGKPDHEHLRNALARLPQTDIPSDAKAEAQKKLELAAKEVGIRTSEVDLEKLRRALESYDQHLISGEELKSLLNEIVIPSAEGDPTVDPTKSHLTDGDSEQDFDRRKLTGSIRQRDPEGQATEKNVPIERDVQTDAINEPQRAESLQAFKSPPKPDVNYTGVGNPNSSSNPRMDNPLDVNPLSVTNEDSEMKESENVAVSANNASSLTDALRNASTNVTAKIIPSISESKMALTNSSDEKNKGEKNMSAIESKQDTERPIEPARQEIDSNKASPQPISVSVKLEGATEIKQAAEMMANIVKETQQQAPKPQAKLSSTEVSQAVQETFEVKERARLDKVASTLRQMANVREDIASAGASGALGQVWSPDMIVLPTDLPANLRRFVQFKEIPRGSKQVNFTTITTPEFGSLIEDTSSTDVAQTISEISVTPSETGAKQRISYVVMESATPDVVQAVERSFQAAALIDEDNIILAACDAATPAATLYGDETVTAESSITSSMTFKGARLASALREIQRKGYAINPGDLVVVLHPVQYDSLLKDGSISQYLYFGSAGPIQQGVIPQVYGVDVVRSTKIPTGTGSGSPAIETYHAQVFLKAQAKAGPLGLGIGGSVSLGVSRDLMIETWRKIDERALYIIASHRAAAGILQPNALVHIYTA